MRYLFLISYFIFSCHLYGQSTLVTNIYLFALEYNDAKLSVHSPRFITKFNEKGYNNQPFFVNDHELLISVKLPFSEQNDIYSLNLSNNVKRQITKTSLSEFSPSLSQDLKFLSCVRVDDPVTSLQRIYSYEYKPGGLVFSPFSDIKNVGYFSWLDQKNVALFLVNKPNQVALVNIDSKDPLIFSSDIGRCLQKNAKGNLIYVHKINDEFWYIKEYDHINQRAAIITETVPGAEDFALTDTGHFIMGKDSKLYSILPDKQKSWLEIADLSYYGIRNIKRIAIHGNNIAIVEQSK